MGTPILWSNDDWLHPGTIRLDRWRQLLGKVSLDIEDENLVMSRDRRDDQPDHGLCLAAANGAKDDEVSHLAFERQPPSIEPMKAVPLVDLFGFCGS